jgi:hypothetical protein
LVSRYDSVAPTAILRVYIPKREELKIPAVLVLRMMIHKQRQVFGPDSNVIPKEEWIQLNLDFGLAMLLRYLESNWV